MGFLWVLQPPATVQRHEFGLMVDSELPVGMNVTEWFVSL